MRWEMRAVRFTAARGLWRGGALAALAGACSAHTPPAPPSPDTHTAVVVGVQMDPSNMAIDQLQISTALGGVTHSSEMLSAASLPHEVRLTPPDGDASAPIAVKVIGFQSSVGAAPLLVRTAETNFLPGQSRLLRIVLQGQCLLGLPGGPPGAPACSAPSTCIAGGCQDDHATAGSLEPYATHWALDAPDYCKPANAGPPSIQVGTGQTDYLPLTDGATVQAEMGPQGGHHVWIAVRQENLKATGSITTITSVQPSTGRVGPKSAFIFTFSPDQGGFCKLAGLRYQLDAGGGDYHVFLGQPLDITVTIADPAGATAVGVAHVEVAPTLLCPSGTSDGGC